MKIYYERAEIADFKGEKITNGGINKMIAGINMFRSNGELKVEPVYIYSIAWHNAGGMWIIEISKKMKPWLAILIVGGFLGIHFLPQFYIEWIKPDMEVLDDDQM